MSATAEAIKAAANEAGHPEPEVLTIKADVGVPESVDALAQKIDEAFGYVDVVINNAAFMKMVSIPDSEPADWLQTLTANVYGPYLIARALAPLLVKSELKTIINISSVGAHLVSPTLSSYQISKLALIRLTEFISVEFADKEIVSYSVHPGNSPSEMLGGIEGIPEAFRAGQSINLNRQNLLLTVISLCRHSCALCKLFGLFGIRKATLAGRSLHQSHLGSSRADVEGRGNCQGRQAQSSSCDLVEN
jgi:NAD(P)-dependent dehydrogenase (short-subunit alcohol dehydrogenase family)